MVKKPAEIPANRNDILIMIIPKFNIIENKCENSYSYIPVITNLIYEKQQSINYQFALNCLKSIVLRFANFPSTTAIASEHTEFTVYLEQAPAQYTFCMKG
ncbi:MAG: hypothetical protein GY928_04755 [Colwellia sp.]|nr:hypothetical protein [Colwellia sp.]